MNFKMPPLFLFAVVALLESGFVETVASFDLVVDAGAVVVPVGVVDIVVVVVVVDDEDEDGDGDDDVGSVKSSGDLVYKR